ncbi:MAG: FAS1-like dehydratase domain-containing protein [Chloroflexota bacterium]
MREQVYFEDIAVDAALPMLAKEPVTLQDLVKWAAASEDFTEFHYDEAAAKQRGFPAPVTNGPYKAALIARALTDWMGPAGVLKKLACQYRRIDVVGDNLYCKGLVTGKRVADGENLVECEVWTENGKGERTTTGTAVVALPSRAPIGADVPSAPASLITDEMRRAYKLGEVVGRFTYDVDYNWIHRYATAIGDENPLWHDRAVAESEGCFGEVIAPPFFWSALDPIETKDLEMEDYYLESVPFKRTGGGNAFTDVEYFLPIRAGDRVTVSTSFSEIYERQGRAGHLIFRVRESELRNGRGELVARTRCGHVLAFDLSQRREG